MALRPSGVRPAAGQRLSGRPGGPAPLRVALIAIAGTLLALAILVWSAWQEGEPRVVLDMPKASAPDPAPLASGDGDGSGDRGDGQDAPADADEAVDPGESQAEAVLDVGEPPFFERPMQVVRRSNIRALPTPDSTALARAEEGTMVILVDPQPTRGYYRIATGELEGWIWGANLIPTDPSQQPDAPEADPEEAAPAADDRPADAASRP